jgi:hypothetical protein
LAPECQKKNELCQFIQAFDFGLLDVAKKQHRVAFANVNRFFAGRCPETEIAAKP